MREIRLKVPSPAFVLALVALCVAVGGSAYAGVRLGKGAVRTKNLHNQAVTERKLRDSAVTKSKLADGAVTQPKLGRDAVGHLNLAPGAVQTSNFAASGFARVSSGPSSLSPGECGLTDFDAPGVEHGDAVAYSVDIPDTIPPGYGPVSVSPASRVGTAGSAEHDVLLMSVCNAGTSTEQIDGVRLFYVAIRQASAPPG
jgi:hypothetical protein